METIVMSEGRNSGSAALAADDSPAKVRQIPLERSPAARAVSSRVFHTWFAVAFVVAFGLVWIYVAVMPMAFLSRDYPLWIAKRAMLDECRLGDVAVFGDSRTLAAIQPSGMPVSVSNFALSGTSPVETYFAVQRALRCPILPKFVVIAHGARKFGGDSDYWVFSARTGFLSYADMRQVGRDAAELHDNQIEKLQPDDQVPMAVREILFSLRFPAFYFDSLVNGGLAIRWQHNKEALNDAVLSSGHALFGTDPGSSGVATEGSGAVFSTSRLVDLYFSRTIALLAERGVPVYFLSMPVNQATYTRTSPELKEHFATYLQSKANELPNLHVVGPAIACWPNRFFGDAWHFNERGASEYSQAFGEWSRHVLADEPSPAPGDRCGDDDANEKSAVPPVLAGEPVESRS